MKKFLSNIFIGFAFATASAQTYIPYGSYVSSSGPFGQPFLRTQYFDNVLFSAPSRFGVTAPAGNLEGLFDGSYDSQPCLIPAGTTAVITIDFTSKGGNSMVYPGGKVLLSFYYLSVPASVSGRMQRNDGTWFNMTGWTNISTLSGHAVWEGTISGLNNGKTLEITVVAPGAAAASLTEIEYIHARPEAYETGVLTKFTHQNLYKNVNWRNSNNVVSATISSEGAAYFNGTLGLGINSPSAQLHTTGSVRFAGITNNNAQTRVLMSDNNGNIYYRDANTLGWSYGGNPVAALNNIGTTSNYPLPFITNNVERMRIGANGNVGIGTTNIDNPDYKLYVHGSIRTRKVRVDQDVWADYVFEDSYPLQSLKEIEEFIQKNKHLPEVPSAAEVAKEGVDLGDNQVLLLKKIEELTLHLISQNKRIEQLENELKKVKGNLLY